MLSLSRRGVNRQRCAHSSRGLAGWEVQVVGGERGQRPALLQMMIQVCTFEPSVVICACGTVCQYVAILDHQCQYVAVLVITNVSMLQYL